MNNAELKSFATPDETRDFAFGQVEVVTVGGAVVNRQILQPGWRWSTSVRPVVHTTSCEAQHFAYHVSGVLKVVLNDGTEFECRAGDVSLIPAGHDAWVVGDEPVVLVDFQGLANHTH